MAIEDLQTGAVYNNGRIDQEPPTRIENCPDYGQITVLIMAGFPTEPGGNITIQVIGRPPSPRPAAHNDPHGTDQSRTDIKITTPGIHTLNFGNGRRWRIRSL